MSRHPTPGATGKSARAAAARARFDRLRAARQRSSMFGVPELIGLAAALVLVLAAVFSYLYFLTPQRMRLAKAKTDRVKIEEQLRAATEGVNRNANTQATVDEILQSLQDFEVRYLTLRNQGSTAVIEELNRLIRRNSLRITTGISFTQLEETAPGETQARVAPGAARAVQSVFPGIGIALSVEGGYANLRRFIKDVEADRQFIVVNAVELEGVAETNASRAAPVATDRETGASPATSPPLAGGSRIVSLRLDLATYFRRANVPTTLAPTEGAR